MNSLKQMQKDIQELPEEAQTLLMDFIEILKKRYPQPDQPNAKSGDNPLSTTLEPIDPWEVGVFALGQPCQVSLSHAALSSEGVYE